MRDDLYMLMKLLQNSNSTEWVLKCLNIENWNPNKLRNDISASRLNVFETMTMQSKLYNSLLDTCISLDPELEMF